MTEQLLLAVAAVVVAPLVGGLLFGLDRKLSARLQGRIGPPIRQPFYDVIKLLAKELIVTTKAQSVFVWGYLLFTVAALVLFALGQDYLLIVFVLGFGGVSFIAAGYSTKSPYAVIGAQREIFQMLAYEPALILSAVAVYLVNGNFGVADIVKSGKPLLPAMPLIFLTMLVVLLVKMRKSPFDFAAAAHAHQELVRGILTEFSGPHLAMIEVTHWYELVLVLAMLGLFWASAPVVGLVIAVAAFVFAIVVDNISARLTWPWMLRTSWSFGVGLATLNIAYLYLIRGG
jgi:formate hydrogenlyase subunit 4